MDEVNYPGLGGGRNRRRWVRWTIAAFVFALLALALALVLLNTRAVGIITYQMECYLNFNQIGIAILMYADDHNDQYPDSFGTLLATEDISPSAFVCQETSDTPAKGPTTQAIVADLNRGGHSSYVYLGRGFNTKTVPADAVVAYEPLEDHKTAVTVLFGDGRVRFLFQPQANQFLAKVAAGQRPVIMPSIP